MSELDEERHLLFNRSKVEPNSDVSTEKQWLLRMMRQQIRFALIFFASVIQAGVLFLFGRVKEQFPVMMGLSLIACLIMAVLSASIFILIVIRKHRRLSGAEGAYATNIKSQIR